MRMSTPQQEWHRAMTQGAQRFSQGKAEHAIKAFTLATKISPERIEGWANLGSALVEAGHNTRALKVLKKALALDAQQPAALLMLGDALRNLGDLSAALSLYQKAVLLQRSPHALNRLGCALRAVGQKQAAAELYQEAIKQQPDFTLARINHAGVLLELGETDSADQQVRMLAGLQLPANELSELDMVQKGVALHRHFGATVEQAIASDDWSVLADTLLKLPSQWFVVDQEFTAEFQGFADTANAFSSDQQVAAVPLPENWNALEATVQSGGEFSAARYATGESLQQSFEDEDSDEDYDQDNDGVLQHATNLAAAIEAADSSREIMGNNVQAQVQLRRWHALACAGRPVFQPGHFKYASNEIAQGPTQRLVEPAKTIGTLRYFMRELYPHITPGLPRAICVWMVLCRIHPFVDGNGRVGRLWSNRELIWAGQMPALFPPQSKSKNALEQTMRRIYEAGNGDVTAMFKVFVEAQRLSQKLCTQSAQMGGVQSIDSEQSAVS